MIAKLARLTLASLLFLTPGVLGAQAADGPEEVALRHQSIQWLTIEPHLPDPQTGTPVQLQTAADVLRARRLPEDALDYYRFALNRGGSTTVLMNRIGVTELELRRPNAAIVAFRAVLAMDKRNAEAWNNLGAAQYMTGDFRSALTDYRKAVKLDRKAAVFHSNLGTALFERQDFEGARFQFAAAIKLDPSVFQHSSWAGVQAHVMSATDRGRFCFEMARLAAQTHNDEGVLLWLARAAEAGFDLKSELGQSRELNAYRHDARVALILTNATSMRAHQLASAPIPALPSDTALN